MTKNLILVKLGGSLITDKNKPFTARGNVISRLAKEIKQALQKRELNLIIGHGSGSFGHTEAAKYSTRDGLAGGGGVEGLSKVADVALELNKIVNKQFVAHELPVISFSPRSFVSPKSQRVFVDPIRKALALGVIPLVHGDVVMDQNSGFTIFSTETVLNILAKQLSREYSQIKIIYCGITNGVYDAGGRTIARISPSNFEKVKNDIKGSQAIDITGGMIHKVEESLNIAKSHKIETLIVNGSKRGIVKDVLLNNKVKSTCVSYV